ncbi:hypothetical protein K437DRAFT_260186 [Tilletiaria anomala UBC 951]|uniref:HNH nuclease domain-containing protein n=1 Tax=Tilletiaria anomala (strain ATCC 24038 / CBS 436.72 / UBC 951) TaxID=1037660 RepID=A0A066VBW7_TILAU|nr:uncharacterized protein K437DRAFT_260186 [Tilletiaria anomala UBC 951]KDN36249.1 hypothetical protein K437DRAFT_260186 [Tilletiaria anomala UBC 951]
MQPVTYIRASESWGGQKFKAIDKSGQVLVSIPIQFARDGGCNTIGFVLSQVAFCWEQDGFLQSETGQRLEAEAPLFDGTAIFVREDGSTDACTPRKGPRFKYKYRAPTENSNAGTMSNSSRSSDLQSRFRVALIARDTFCLLSGADYEDCVASHILPLSRPEYYAEVLGEDVQYLFKAEYGLLLRSDLHHSFDRGEWALHIDGDNLVVHVFKGRGSAKPYHGQIITPARFHLRPESHPNRDALMFHYQQCSIQRFRGFSSGFD